MTDLTPALNTLLTTKYSAKPTTSTSTSTATSPDDFLKEAYRINTHITSLIHYLHTIRSAYLTTTPTLPPSQRQRQRQQRQTSSIIPPGTTTPGTSTTTSPLHLPLGPTGTATSTNIDPLSDPQRDTIDTSTAQALHDLSTSIANLAAAETLRRQTADTLLRKKYGSSDGVLFRWASGRSNNNNNKTRKPDDDDDDDRGKGVEQKQDEGVARMTRAVREAVLWFLRRTLEGAVEVQRGMVERRIERVREREKSVLYKSVSVSTAGGAGAGGQQPQLQPQPQHDMDHHHHHHHHHTHTDATTLSASELAAIEAQLTPHQLQLFAEENDSMLRHYEETLSKVQNAEKSLVEIASLQQTLVGHLATQEDFIGQLVSDASSTQTNVGAGNRELKRASEARSSAQVVFWGTVGLCTGLVVWDLIF